MLWLIQSTAFVPALEGIVHYDCQVAGQAAAGRWRTNNSLGDKLRHLERYADAVLPHGLWLEYTRAHVGNAWNEMADVLAKQAAKACKDLPKPPLSNITALLEVDTSWWAAEHKAAQDKSLPLQPGRGLVWHPTHEQGPTNITCEELIPTTTLATVGAEEVIYCTKVLSVNIQGYRDKIKYLEQQLLRRQCQIAMFQENQERRGPL